MANAAELDLAAAHADKPKLKRFEGRDVLGTTVKVTNAGDGLSDALKIEPREFKHGERVYLVLECEVTQVAHKPLAEGVKELVRVHTLRAGAATVVDADLVQEHITRQAERIQRAIDEAKGRQNLDGEPGYLADSDGDGEVPESVALRRHHMASRHTAENGGPVDGCPLCQAEAGGVPGEPAEHSAEPSPDNGPPDPDVRLAAGDGTEGGDA